MNFVRIISLFFIVVLAARQSLAQYPFPPEVAKWNADSLGNQRAVLLVKGEDKFAKASIAWRNRQVTADQLLFIVDSARNRLVENIHYGAFSEEKGDFIFEATSGSGIYYVYYLPYRLKGSRYYPEAEYLKRPVEQESIKSIEAKNSAILLRLEAVDEFNSNDPMEVTATEAEVQAYLQKFKGESYFVFPERYTHPIKMSSHLPRRWVEGKSGLLSLEGETERGAYYAFQLGLWSAKTDLKDVQVGCSSLKSENGAVLSADAFDCINTQGISYTEKPMSMKVDVPQSKVQALWCGLKIPKDTKPGIYSGTVHIKPANAPEKIVQISLTVLPAVAVNGGVDEPWRMTRLPWLNSTLAQENSVIKPYTPLEVEGDTAISLLGRKVVLDASGFPKQILSYFTPEMTSIGKTAISLLAEPIHFHVTRKTGKGDVQFKAEGLSLTKKQAGTVSWISHNVSDELTMEVAASLEFDGFVNYVVKLVALKDLELQDIAMHIPYQPQMATYMLGLGKKGGFRPDSISWKWDVAKKNQDGAWIGNVNAGIQFSLRDEKYQRPLNTNFYLQKPLLLPSSWGNGNKGGIDISMEGASLLVNNYSGERNMRAGDTLYYNFTLLLTPFHALNTEAQWDERYFHAYKPVDTVKKSGANVINIHHANALNPYINYPFIATKEMKAYIDSAHQVGLKVKIYNTVREVSNRMYELYPLRSLGHEVFSAGPGKGYSWLQEHLHDDYIAAWFVPYYKDAAIINSGMNRWHNYYVEGMNWLVDHIGIDGIYLDDVAFDRVTMKRIKRVMTKNGRPGLIDLHSANQYNERDGFNNSAHLYLEHFPYLNRLWFGEYFDYENNNPDFFLTEISGIPFGLMGEMLQDGGNPWRGMIYGMTNRLPYQKSGPQALWKAWDDFGIKGSQMIGYWVDNSPVKTDHQQVLATVFKKEGKIMLALASWAEEDVQVNLSIDWKGLGIDSEKATIYAPEIADFQQATKMKLGETVPVAKNKGWLLIIE
ncbi:glycoside hydrolase domain-containing protein [Olivibacter sitiensis]|uniref:glycoside hydrolase domain-containing protein n=1 Tax=Olivibacter sitiensis TaxID=376470 RepID=UPI00041C1BD2|nr:glycoside hydrolase domain-containing protein [Olivibacter sitiensis]